MADAVETPVASVATETSASRLSDDPKVVDAIQQHLDAFKDSEEPETPIAEEKPVEEKPVEETPAEVVSPTGETTVEEKPVEAAAPGASTLPAAYIRTAKARGWTDDEIASFVKQGPDVALKMFERMHESRVKEVQEWAELGRKVRQAPVQPPVVSQTAATTQNPLAPAASLQPINIQEMVEKYGNEELVKALAGPVNAAIALLNPIVQDATASRAQARQAQMETLAKTVQDFFTDANMAPFAETYGKDLGTLTPAQVETRSKVLETADALIAGAAYQGRQLSVQDALTLAHDSVSSGTKETIIREQIRKNVVKRGKGLTLKPTAQGRRDAGGAPKDRQELIGRTEDRLSKAFG
jgi:hypothetical protein